MSPEEALVRLASVLKRHDLFDADGYYTFEDGTSITIEEVEAILEGK